MDNVIAQLGSYGLIPVVKIDNLKDAEPLADALIKGGLPVAEITFRTDAAEEAIKTISSARPEMLVGAGTVVNTRQAEAAVKAGAKFLVSPGLDAEIVKFCAGRNIPFMPGVATPTEVQSALGMGLEVLKFFPAETLGGVEALKAISAPLAGAKFVPLGGISAENLNTYLSFPKVFACGGTWMVKDNLIKEGRFDKITELTSQAISTMLGFELAHVGLNAPDAEASIETTRAFAAVFNMPVKEGNSSNFAGTGIEVNKAQGRGNNGHIAIKTNYIDRAIFHLQAKNVAVDDSSAKKDASGSLVAVYLKEEIGGFAIHLLQKK